MFGLNEKENSGSIVVGGTSDNVKKMNDLFDMDMSYASWGSS